MLLVYTHKITPRLLYIMKHIFTKMLQIEVTFTTKVEDFIAHSGAKITYTRQPLQNEFFIKSHDLLFDQGIQDIEINVQSWAGIPCFFETSERSVIPYDIFAASFYLLSRYEEYLPHVKDEHSRYPATESVAYKYGFLEKPVVDLWIAKFKQALLKRFPYLELPQRKFHQTPIIDVPVSHCFRERGIIRSLGGIIVDFFSLKLGRLFKRFMVLSRIRRDPYNNYAELIAYHKRYKTDAMFFFLFADYSNYDKNISVNNNVFRILIKTLADYNKVSLIASYDSFDNVPKLKKERQRFIDLIKRPVNSSRLRFNRMNLPETYKNLVEAEFNKDYSMGYRRIPGFRAGTSIPFYFYDISYEVQLPLKVHPFCIDDYSLIKYTDKEDAKTALFKIRDQVKEVKGNFICTFSNELLGGAERDFIKELYIDLIKEDAIT